MAKFGGDTNPLFLDAYLCQIEFLVNKTLDGTIPLAQKQKDVKLLNEVVEKNIQLARKINVLGDETKDESKSGVLIGGGASSSKGSEFMQESLLMKIQVLSQTQSSQQSQIAEAMLDGNFVMKEGQNLVAKMDEVIQQMDLIQMETYNELIGNCFIWRAHCLTAMVVIEQGNVKEGLERIEKVVTEQTTQLGTKIHASIDMTYNQLA